MQLTGAEIVIECLKEQGVDTVIANGAKPELLYNIVEGKSGGYTRFFTKD